MSTQTTDTDNDVTILGGGLAGLTLAIQLRRQDPPLRVTVVERHAHPVREAAFKVGESPVEIGAHYFAHVLGLRDPPHRAPVRTLGFRFYFPEGPTAGARSHRIGRAWPWRSSCGDRSRRCA